MTKPVSIELPTNVLTANEIHEAGATVRLQRVHSSNMISVKVPVGTEDFLTVKRLSKEKNIRDFSIYPLEGGSVRVTVGDHSFVGFVI